MKIALCTLYEGHYHYGVAALANSLSVSGYAGTLHVGYRGELPQWVVTHPSWDAGTRTLRLNDRFCLYFELQDTPVFFAYYKARFMRRVLCDLAQDCDAVAYIDPDIVLKCQWSAIEVWFQGGLALIEDVNWNLPARHPKRLLWKQWFAREGVDERRSIGRYYNSGFLGVPREHVAFLDLVDRLCMLVLAYNNGRAHIKAGDAPDLFHSTDQDAMNFALCAYEAEVPLNTAGCEAMDFAGGGFYFSHAIGYAKPWMGHHIKLALSGWTPSIATKAYYRYANSPIRVYSVAQFALRRLSLGIASTMGRFYRKA